MIKLTNLLKEINVGQGHSKYMDGNKTSGNNKETLDNILKNIAKGGIEYEEDINESTSPNIMFKVYEQILRQVRAREKENGVRMSIFEEIYPTASSFFQDIEPYLNNEN